MSRTFKNQPKVDRIKKVKQDQNRKSSFKRTNYYDLIDDEEFN